jgi:hypothetical protein
MPAPDQADAEKPNSVRRDRWIEGVTMTSDPIQSAGHPITANTQAAEGGANSNGRSV